MGKRKELYQKLITDVQLPKPSRVALELLKRCHDPSSSIQDIAAVIEIDHALSADLLKYTNSVLFAAPYPVNSVRHAAVMVGLKGVVNLALGFSLISQSQAGKCRAFNYRKFWLRSLIMAVAAREIALSDHCCHPDEIFTCGLLSHVGQLAFASSFPEQYGEILTNEFTGEALLVAEQSVFGLNHLELSSELLNEWGLAEKFGASVFYGTYSCFYNTVNPEVLAIRENLHLASLIAGLCMVEMPSEISLAQIEANAQAHQIPQQNFPEFFNQVSSNWQNWSELFNLSGQHDFSYEQIKNSEIAPLKEKLDGIMEEETLILAIDDDPLTITTVTKTLQDANRQIISAENGNEGLELAIEMKPDIIITDWRMPGLNGLELCRALRSHEATEHAYIIMLTGINDDDEIVEAFDAGADDYVIKPFTPKVLNARVRSGERISSYQKTINVDQQVMKYATKLVATNRQLEAMAMTDALTTLPNRRSTMARMRDVLAESNRFGDQISCIMIDIDYFKRVNDTYGHDNGDRVLKQIAQIFLNNARSYDFVSRMGGEEFLIISSRSSRTDSLHLAERMRKAVSDFEFILNDGNTTSITISLGVASWEENFIDGNDLIRSADRALYRAKNEGRNTVKSAWELGRLVGD